MKGLDTGKDKVKKICDVLRRETLEPAQREAEALLERAKTQAEAIVSKAREEAEQMLKQARFEISREKNVFESSLALACKQTVESLKLQIEEKLLNQDLSRLITKEMQNPKVISELITAVVKAIDKEGIDCELAVRIPAAVPARSINQLLATDLLAKLKDHSVLIGTQTGGVEIQLKGKNMTLDITDDALTELIARFAGKDFRQLMFAHG